MVVSGVACGIVSSLCGREWCGIVCLWWRVVWYTLAVVCGSEWCGVRVIYVCGSEWCGVCVW